MQSEPGNNSMNIHVCVLLIKISHNQAMRNENEMEIQKQLWRRNENKRNFEETDLQDEETWWTPEKIPVDVN